MLKALKEFFNRPVLETPYAPYEKYQNGVIRTTVGAEVIAKYVEYLPNREDYTIWYKRGDKFFKVHHDLDTITFTDLEPEQLLNSLSFRFKPDFIRQVAKSVFNKDIPTI